MASDLIEVIIKAIDQASGPAKSVDNAVNKMGDAAERANQKAAQASELYNQKISETKNRLAPVVDKFNDVGNTGSQSFKKLSSAQQDSITKFNMLDHETQTTLQAVRELGIESMDLIPGADTAIAKLASMDDHVKTFGGSFDYAKSKMELMGNSTDSLKGKIQLVGTGIQTYIGNKWDSIKSKVSSFGGYIKSSLSSALSTVRSKIESLGNAFSGLGGIMSSVMGGIGLKSMADMTIGASVNRDRIFNLSYAILGAGQSMDDFKNKSDSLWNVMDAGTNQSLVGLDQISQAMSVINMSANMSQDQLKAIEPLILDIGQRAILMGKEGDEAVSLMQAAGKGLNGEFEMLRENLGITKDKLEAAGWSGAADDIDGYTKALETCLKQSGDVSDMMNTTSGKLTRIKKYWGLAGRSIGDDFLPYLDQALTGLVNFLDADKDGALDARGKQWLQYGYGVMAAGSAFATAAPQISSVLSVFDTVGGKVGDFRKHLKDGQTVLGGFWTTLRSGQGIQAAITAGYNAMAISEYIALGPLLLIIAAIIAIGVAVYELGKYFGWWTDVGSMLQAVWAGLQRLWSAFINHPDVQGFLAGVSDAFGVVSGAIMWAVNGILEFFNISQGGEFDAVHAIIMGIGAAWEVLGAHLRTAYDILAYLAPYVMEVFGTIQEQVGAVAEVFQQFQNGQVSLLDVIWSIGTAIYQVWLSIQTQVATIVVNLASQLLTWAIQAGANFVNGLKVYLSQVAGRVNTWLNNAKLRIIAQLTAWVTYGKTKASQFLSGVINYFSQLPGKAYTWLYAVVSQILSAGRAWVTNAKQKASDVVKGAVGVLEDLPGKVASALGGVKDAIVKPFQDAYDTAKDWWDKIVNLASNTPNPASGGDNPASGGDIDSSYIASSNDYYIVENVHSGEITVVFDLQNVPDNISTADLNRMLENVSKSETFGRNIAENLGFQNHDLKIKTKIKSRNMRARGV